MNINTKYIKDLDLGSASTNTSVTYMVIQEAIGTNPTQKIALDTLFLESTARAKSAVRLVDNNFAVGQRVSGDVELIGTKYDFKRNGVGLFAQYATLLNSLGEYANKNDANTFADSQMFLSAITCDGGIRVPNQIDIFFDMDQVSLETLLQERAVVTDNNTFSGTQSFNNINATGTFAGNTINASAFGIIGYTNPGVTADLATVLSGKANSSYPVFEDGVRIEFQADPQDPNGDTIFEITNTVDSSTPFSINDWGTLQQTKNAYFTGDVFQVSNPEIIGTAKHGSSQTYCDTNTANVSLNGEGIWSAYINPLSHTDDNMEFGDITYAKSSFKGKDIKILTGVGTGETLNGTGDIDIYAKNFRLNGIDIPTSELSGSNYVMVYGVGTPEENANELEYAYNEAKKLPRYIGAYANGGVIINIYKGQTFTNNSIPIKFFTATADYNGTLGAAPAGTFLPNDIQADFDKALATRATVVVAPGTYTFATANSFTVNERGINLVSLTGNRDVIINGITVTSNTSFIKGIDCGLDIFNLSLNCTSEIETCSGGDGSFSSSSDLVANLTDCIGGLGSFCNDSGDIMSILKGCKLTAGTFKTPTTGKLINCIDGDGNVVSFPSQITGGSDIKIPVYDSAWTYYLTNEDKGKTLIVDTNGLASSVAIAVDSSVFSNVDLDSTFYFNVISSIPVSFHSTTSSFMIATGITGGFIKVIKFKGNTTPQVITIPFDV